MWRSGPTSGDHRLAGAGQDGLRLWEKRRSGCCEMAALRGALQQTYSKDTLQTLDPRRQFAPWHGASPVSCSPRGIRVNAVSPGPIDSGILEKPLPPEVAEQTKAQMASDNPMQRMGASTEIAKAMVFLAFEATFTTGTELAVDGGGSQL